MTAYTPSKLWPSREGSRNSGEVSNRIEIDVGLTSLTGWQGGRVDEVERAEQKSDQRTCQGSLVKSLMLLYV
jgi:hypothetical protein